MSAYRPVIRALTPRISSCIWKSRAMPLKAKIMGSRAGRYSTTSATDIGPSELPKEQPIKEQPIEEQPMKEQPGDDPQDVLFSTIYGLRTIELNRPGKLNSLDGSMARKILARLKEWEKSDLANVIVIQGAGRAFCAGGDVAALARWNEEGPSGAAKSCDYFALEYKLDHVIATYTKPYIAYMDGITMGGGVGLAAHAPFRIATENTVFAMPETTIGFFPDVGASFFLPKLDGGIGMYLALTSAQLKGVDVLYHGIATHYIHSSSLPSLSSRLSELRFNDYADLPERYDLIASTIAEFNTGLPCHYPQIRGRQRQYIDYCFQNTDALTILRALDTVRTEAPEPSDRQWADATIEKIRFVSPTSVAVTARQMNLSQNWDIAETFQKEHEMASVFMHHPDFTEGVTSLLIKKSKTRPNWQPNAIEDVTDDEISRFFQRGETPLALLSSGASSRYRSYPHKYLALPTEEEILRVCDGGQKGSEEVVAHFLNVTNGKVGVREKVEEVLQRAMDPLEK